MSPYQSPFPIRSHQAKAGWDKNRYPRRTNMYSSIHHHSKKRCVQKPSWSSRLWHCRGKRHQRRWYTMMVSSLIMTPIWQWSVSTSIFVPSARLLQLATCVSGSLLSVSCSFLKYQTWHLHHLYSLDSANLSRFVLRRGLWQKWWRFGLFILIFISPQNVKHTRSQCLLEAPVQ